VKTECPIWAPPLLAIQFLTTIPIPALKRLEQNAVATGLSRSVAWFPLVGTLVGAVTAATLLLTEQLWPRLIAVLLALAIEARLTGAFHEDAVADFCDGIGGGRNPTHTREIMKDSRIGTFGTLGLTLALALRASLMFFLDPAIAALAIIAAATFARLFTVIVMVTIAPAPGAAGLANNVTSQIRGRDVALACLTSFAGLLPFAVNAPLAMLCAGLIAAVFLLWFRALLIRRVGGTTGDCLGFAAYAAQLILLLAATAR
jgi:adenosylcobinamide-GDP ribazoletransferase